jgi:hypothetical protein
MKSTSIFAIALVFLLSCEKENTLQVYSTETISNIFYFNAVVEDTAVTKNLAWYDTRSFYSEYHTEIIDELRFNYDWDSRYFLNSNSKNYSSDYYDLLTGGSLTIGIYDSTLLDSIFGRTVKSNAFGNDLKIDLTIGLDNTRYWNKESVFDIRINSIKDTAIVYHYGGGTENFKIYSISIPQITLQKLRISAI